MINAADSQNYCAGVAFFRGAIPPRLENFTQLAEQGVTVQARAGSSGAHWSSQIVHPQWGAAEALCLRDFTPPPASALKFDPRLTDADRSAGTSAGSCVCVRTLQKEMLRDRKKLLRFVNLFMGDDGLIASDATAQKFWSRDALSEELIHDADLDIESLFVAHYIYSSKKSSAGKEERNTYWLHTHGLAAIGALDFDILKPAPSLGQNGWDVIRALAYLSLDKGRAIAGQTLRAVSPGNKIAFVPVKEFNQTADPADIALREDPKDPIHNQDRVILCEPKGGRRLLGLLPARSIPSRTLSTLDGDRVIAGFPGSATTQMAARARKTFHLFRELTKEFADMQINPIAKIGYPVDGGDAESREHMWFEVKEIGSESLDAVLINDPQQVSRMKKGDRRQHPLAFLTDWMIFTPAGGISPRNMLPVRVLRARGDEIRRALAKRNSPQSF